MTDGGESIRARVGLLLGAAVFAMMAWPIARGEVALFDDLSFYFLPLRGFLADCLARGEDPSWCPNLLGGFFLAGESNGQLHPWVRLIYGALPLDLALNVERLASYPVLFAGFLAMAGRRGLRRDAAAFGGLLFAFGGYNLGHYMHQSVLPMLAHLPWILVSIDVAMRTGDPRRRALAQVAVGLLTASQVSYGHVQFAWISGVGEAAYALHLARRVPGSARQLGLLAVCKGLGLLGASVQLAPLWDAFRESRRHRPTRTFVAMGSLPPLNIIQWVAPYLSASRVVTPPMAIDGDILEPSTSMWDWRVKEFAIYYGAAVPALLIWLFLDRKAPTVRAPRGLSAFAALLALGAFVLALGDSTRLFDLTMRIPVVGLFRVPARYLLLVHLGVALLSAIAFDGLAGRGEGGITRLPWRRLWPMGLPPILSVLVCFAPGLPEGLWPAYLRGPHIAGTPWVIAGPVLIATGTALVAFAARGSRPALVALLVFSAADQAFYGYQVMAMTPDRTIADFRAARPIPPGDATHRVKFERLNVIWHNTYLLNGLRTVSGYVSLAPRRRLRYDRPSSLRVAGVGWVMPTEDEGGQPWRPVPDPLPRARLVTRVVRSADPDRDLDRIDVATTALVSPGLAPDLPGGPPGAARLVGDRPGKLDVMSEAASRQFLVVSESYHAGWRLKIDGRTCPVARAYGDFLGCVVPPGRHHVQFRFRPTSLMVGPRLSALGLALIVVVPMAALRRQARAAGAGGSPGARGIPRPYLVLARRARAARRPTAGGYPDPSRFR